MLQSLTNTPAGQYFPLDSNADTTRPSNSNVARQQDDTHTPSATGQNVSARQRRSLPTGLQHANLMNPVAAETTTTAQHAAYLKSAWGLLSSPSGLTDQQRNDINSYVAKHFGNGSTLMDFLRKAAGSTFSESDSPHRQLKTLFESPSAKKFADNMAAHFKDTPFGIDPGELLKVALITQIDPTAGTEHRKIAGYDLQQIDNQGKTHAQIVEGFTQHLIDKDPRLSGNSRMMTHLLLSGVAPELTLSGVPASLRYGSIESANLTAETNYYAKKKSFDTSDVSFEEIIRNKRVKPRDNEETQDKRESLTTAALDWARLNGVISNSPNYEHTEQDVTTAVNALTTRMDKIKKAAETLDEPFRTRETVAQNMLTDEFGRETPLHQELLQLPLIPYISSDKYSLLDLYMREDKQIFKEYRSLDNRALDYSTMINRLESMPTPSEKFEETFKSDLLDKENALSGILASDLQDLPTKDREILSNSDIEAYNAHTLWDLSGVHRRALPIQPINHLIKATTPAPDSKTYYYEKKQGELGFTRRDDMTPLELTTKYHFDGWLERGASTIRTTLTEEERKNQPPQTTEDRLHLIASTLIKPYQRAFAAQKDAAYGETANEQFERKSNAIGEFILGVIPLYNSVKSFSQGNIGDGFFYLLVDFTGVVAGAAKGGSLAAEILTSSLVKTPLKVLKRVVTD